MHTIDAQQLPASRQISVQVRNVSANGIYEAAGSLHRNKAFGAVWDNLTGISEMLKGVDQLTWRATHAKSKSQGAIKDTLISDLWLKLDRSIDEALKNYERRLLACQTLSVKGTIEQGGPIVRLELERRRIALEYWLQCRDIAIAAPQYQHWRDHLSCCVELHNATAALSSGVVTVVDRENSKARLPELSARALAEALAHGAIPKHQALRLTSLICDYWVGCSQQDKLPPYIAPLWQSMQSCLHQQNSKWPASALNALFPRKLVVNMPSDTMIGIEGLFKLSNLNAVQQLTDDYQQIALSLSAPLLTLSHEDHIVSEAFQTLVTAAQILKMQLFTASLFVRVAFLNGTREVTVTEDANDVNESIDVGSFGEYWKSNARDDRASVSEPDIDYEELLSTVSKIQASPTPSQWAYLETSFTDKIALRAVPDAQTLESTEWIKSNRFCAVCYRTPGLRRYCRVHSNTGGKGRVSIGHATKFEKEYATSIAKLMREAWSFSERRGHRGIIDFGVAIPSSGATTVSGLRAQALSAIDVVSQRAYYGVSKAAQSDNALELINAKAKELRSILLEHSAPQIAPGWVRTASAMVQLKMLSETCLTLIELLCLLCKQDQKSVADDKSLAHELAVFLGAYCVDVMHALIAARSEPDAIAAVALDIHRDFFTKWFEGYVPRYTIGHKFIAEARDPDFVKLQIHRSAFDLDCMWEHFVRLAAWRYSIDSTPAQRKPRIRRLPRDEVQRLRTAGKSLDQIAMQYDSTVPSVKAAIARWDAEGKTNNDTKET